MATVDDYVKTPERPIDKPFLLPVEQVLTIKGKGVVCTGKIERGKVKVGDKVEIAGYKRKGFSSQVQALEMFHKTLDKAQAGDQCGVLLKGMKADDARRGMVLCEPNKAGLATKFEADLYVCTTEEGGRKKPFMGSYRPQAYIRTGTVTVGLTLPEGVEMVMPGDTVSGVKFECEFPFPMEVGVRFALREGGVTVASGNIAKVEKLK